MFKSINIICFNERHIYVKMYIFLKMCIGKMGCVYM